MKSQKIVLFSEAKKSILKNEECRSGEKKIKMKGNRKEIVQVFFCITFIVIAIYGFFTSLYYINYKIDSKDWSMSQERKDEKKCEDFRKKYKQKYDSQDIKNVSNKCLLSLIDEKIDYSEIFHYYIEDNGKAAFQATANIEYDGDFLNPLSQKNEEHITYRTVQVNIGCQDIIQDTDIYYRIENGTISDNWYEFYKTILETKYDGYYIDNYFENFFTNPPECHGVNITFYKHKKSEKITLLITKNAYREDEFHDYIESVAKRKWQIDDKEGPLDYLLKYSLNYPNMSYMIPAEIDEPKIEIGDILIYSFRGCFESDNSEPIVCTNSLIDNVQRIQRIIFEFVVLSCFITPIVQGLIKREIFMRLRKFFCK